MFHHIVGKPQSSDRLVYEEKDPGFFMGVGGSLLDDFIFIDIHDHETSEYRLLSTKDLTAEPQLVAEREEGVEYSTPSSRSATRWGSADRSLVDSRRYSEVSWSWMST